jgi:hypothetical protein
MVMVILDSPKGHEPLIAQIHLVLENVCATAYEVNYGRNPPAVISGPPRIISCPIKPWYIIPGLIVN